MISIFLVDTGAISKENSTLDEPANVTSTVETEFFGNLIGRDYKVSAPLG